MALLQILFGASVLLLFANLQSGELPESAIGLWGLVLLIPRRKYFRQRRVRDADY